jgi:hypothetical protein
MPRLDHQVRVEQALPYETEMVLRLLVDQLNRIMPRIQLPPINEEQVRQAVKKYLRDHPRPRGK